MAATAEDYAALNAAWRDLVICSRQRSLAFNNSTLATAAERALDQNLRLREWLRKKTPLAETEAQSLTVKGMHVTERKA